MTQGWKGQSKKHSIAAKKNRSVIGKKIFKTNFLIEKWGDSSAVLYKGKKYRIGRMSYGDYFLEPFEIKAGEGRLHSSRTLWLEKIDADNYRID